MPNRPLPVCNLAPDWRPHGRELADADVIAGWQVLARACGPYFLTGAIGGRQFLASLQAMDAAAGWALTADRLLVLGERDPQTCVALLPDEITRRAAAPAEERDLIQAEASALAERARRVGMPIFAYLLEVAGIEAANYNR
jgi:hypothetical protein